LFFDFHVHNDNELVREAERLGYNGVALFNRAENEINKSVLPDNDPSFQIKSGLAVHPKNTADLKRKIQKHRMKTDVLMVNGGDLKINRAACENPQVDILSNPYWRRRDCVINDISARKAAENDVAVELNTKYLLNIKPQLRYKILGYYREILKLQRKFDFPLIITSGADSIFDLHTPPDLIALTYCFGMTEEEAFIALSETPRDIIIKNSVRGHMLVEGAKIID